MLCILNVDTEMFLWDEENVKTDIFLDKIFLFKEQINFEENCIEKEGIEVHGSCTKWVSKKQLWRNTVTRIRSSGAIIKQDSLLRLGYFS